MNKNEISKYPLPLTMSEHIFTVLKESIINNKLQANQRINEKELSEQFRVSRTPVREAVLRLASEGFVIIDSYKRAIVSEISYKELKEILQVLGALDRLAITMAVDNMTLKDITKLERLVKRMEKSCNFNSIETYLGLNVTFHNGIWEAVPNKMLREMLYLVRDKMLRYNYAQIHAFKKPGILGKSMKQHIELVRAIKAKDKEKLKTLIVKHRGSLWEPSAYKEGIKEYLNTEQGE
jgi:DNA-binding GntR family transcriptional regulator